MRLPEIQARPQGAERPSMAAVRPTDLGLGAAAQEREAWEAENRRTQLLEEEVQREQDDVAVRPLIEELQSGFEAHFAEAGAAWDGITPGFARGVDTAFEAASRPFVEREDLTPGQMNALNRGVSRYREAVGQRAISYQAQRRGALAAQAAEAREAVAVGRVMGDYMTRLGERKGERDRTYDGSTPDYAAGVLADHDEIAAELIEAAPEALRARVTQRLATQRLQLQGQAMDTEARAEQAHVAAGVRDAGTRLVNGVASAPSLYHQAVAEVEGVVAGLPPAARATARAGLLDEIASAHIEGLIRDGQQDAALDRLNSGALDDQLSPSSKARLLNAATRSRDALNVDDWIARMTLQSRIEDDITSRMTTGQGVEGVDPGTVAGVLGEREAAEYMLAVQNAEAAFQSLTGYAQMTPAEIRAHVASLAPEPGAPGFAADQQRYEAARRVAEAEIAAREADPAAWALGQSPTLQAQAGRIGQGSEAETRRAAGAYAVGMLTLQETAGVPAAERRVLPQATAAQMVAAQQQNADPAAGLQGLGAVIRAFDAPPGASGETITAAFNRQRMVINELRAAGADNGDIAAAMDLADDPVRLGRYVHARRAGALDGLDRRERERVEDLVDRELSSYLRSFEGVPLSASLTGGRRLMGHRLAALEMAGGADARRAARDAAEVIAGGYVFVGPSGWRMPRAEAERRMNAPGEPLVHGQTLVQRGASRTLGTLTRDGGAGLYAPADDGSGMTEAQRRERYADSVTARGRWMTTPDDRGLVLMHPGLDGRWVAALDREGRPVTRNWSSLRDAGRDRRTRAGLTSGGRAPRGIRNNNPGNIEARGNIRWQGQAGSDGRFARFETPEHGLRALARDLHVKHGRGLNTVQSIITTWAPPSENNTAAYVNAVARALQVAPNQRLDFDDPRIVPGLMAAIIQHENGQQPYSPALLQEAARRGRTRR